MLFHAKAILSLRYDNFSHYLTPLDKILGQGNIGVDIFLFLSGACLYFSFQKSRDMGKYLRKRAQRLYLPAIVIDGWYWLVFSWLLGGTFLAFFRNITLLDFWITGGQLIWFVSLILLLYILYPYIYAIIFDGSEKYAWLRAVLLIAAVIALNEAFGQAAGDLFAKYEIALGRVPVFIAGTFAGKYVFENKKLPWLIYPAAAAVVLCGCFLFPYNMFDGVHYRYWSTCMGLSVMVLLELFLRTVRFAGMHKLLAVFGGMSLELYLAHVMLTRIYRISPFGEEERLLEYMVLLLCAVAIAWAAKKICDRISSMLQSPAGQPQ
jgi:peptidoglycan/LPS O-acetylase OafA/YrhL